MYFCNETINRQLLDKFKHKLFMYWIIKDIKEREQYDIKYK